MLFLSLFTLSAWAALPELGFQEKLAALDSANPGVLGVYVKRLSDSEVISYQGDRYWYLSSTVKIPIAIAILKKVEQGGLSLDQKLTLKASDYVDGAGDLQRTQPGTEFSVEKLLEKMVVNSDSSATDMLVRLLGAESLNGFLEGEFGDFTPLLQVRYEAYGELHPRAARLTNIDFIELKKFQGEARMVEFARRIGVKRNELKAPTLEEAFERYYKRNLNSSSLEAFGQMLEKLVKRELLSPEHTALLLGFMGKITTGERRLKKGFPKGIEFAQKTGTQVNRVCNMGIVRPSANPVVIAACVEKASQAEAEALLVKVGQLISQDLL